MNLINTTQGPRYAVDLVLCIDGTGSMEPVIEEVKSSTLNFFEQLGEKLSQQRKRVDQFRTKVIVFRDYWADSKEMAMISSDFFTLPNESDKFNKFVSDIYADGGGDAPENGLEALALAIQSPWEEIQDFARKRHIIVLFTDTSTHDLTKVPKPKHYPTDIPQTFELLTNAWHAQLSDNSKRLLLFAPEMEPWTLIQQVWNNVIFFPSQAGQGLEEFEMDEILNAIVKSV
jgi:hypothetical protein